MKNRSVLSREDVKELVAAMQAYLKSIEGEVMWKVSITGRLEDIFESKICDPEKFAEIEKNLEKAKQSRELAEMQRFNEIVNIEHRIKVSEFKNAAMLL